jgi:hypothetical protein
MESAAVPAATVPEGAAPGEKSLRKALVRNGAMRIPILGNLGDCPDVRVGNT